MMECACTEEDGAITSLCLGHRIAMTANGLDGDATKDERIRELEGALDEFGIHHQECERAAGGEGLDPEQMCECGLQDMIARSTPIKAVKDAYSSSPSPTEAEK